MKYALTYGLLSGLVIIAIMLTGLTLTGQDSFFSSAWFGYLVMLVALTFIFVGVKRYRDVERGGVIKFGPALVMGLAIAAVAGLAYVAVWEVYLAATDYKFMDEYSREVLAARPGLVCARSQGIAGPRGACARTTTTVVPIPMTSSKSPGPLLVALVSAALILNPAAALARDMARAQPS